MFSARLPWSVPENRLTVLEAARRAAGASLLDLTVTNPTAVGLPYPADALAAALANPAVARYQASALGPAPARAAIAGEYARQGAQIPPEAIALTASSSESYALLFKLLCDPGDTVLVPAPSYPLFEYLAALEGIRLRPYRLSHGGGEWHIDWGSVDARGARAVVVVSPNNPTGSYVRRGDLDGLQALAQQHDLALIVDEVFADYPLVPADDAVVTVAAASPRALAFCLGGLSKSCGLPQMKLGWIAAVGPPPLVAAAVGRLELVADTYLSVGGPVLGAVPALLGLGADIRARIAERVRRNRGALFAALGPQVPCTLLPAEAGWSAILRVPAVLTDEEWALALLQKDDVLVQPGYYFDITGLGATLVLSLLTPPDRFDEGVKRILARAAA